MSFSSVREREREKFFFFFFNNFLKNINFNIYFIFYYKRSVIIDRNIMELRFMKNKASIVHIDHIGSGCDL